MMIFSTRPTSNMGAPPIPILKPLNRCSQWSHLTPLSTTNSDAMCKIAVVSTNQTNFTQIVIFFIQRMFKNNNCVTH